MESESNRIASQCTLEHQILQHVKDALRLTLSWDVDSVGLSRKLASVRFTMHSFRRHLERLMALEEEGGYMTEVGQYKPNLSERAGALQTEHNEFRDLLARLSPTVEQISEDDGERFAEICDQIDDLLDRHDLHDQKERCLLQEVCWDDEGGEG